MNDNRYLPDRRQWGKPTPGPSFWRGFLNGALITLIFWVPFLAFLWWLTT